ncbi:MAG: hypothetical protein IJP35_06045 [Clostridia bacterium]|nr:hypothetical protein [Clostridia bacterium]
MQKLFSPTRWRTLVRREGGKTVKSEFVIIREADTLNRHRTKTKVVRKGDPSHTTHL